MFQCVLYFQQNRRKRWDFREYNLACLFNTLHIHLLLNDTITSHQYTCTCSFLILNNICFLLESPCVYEKTVLNYVCRHIYVDVHKLLFQFIGEKKNICISGLQQTVTHKGLTGFYSFCVYANFLYCMFLLYLYFVYFILCLYLRFFFLFSMFVFYTVWWSWCHKLINKSILHYIKERMYKSVWRCLLCSVVPFLACNSVLFLLSRMLNKEASERNKKAGDGFEYKCALWLVFVLLSCSQTYHVYRVTFSAFNAVFRSRFRWFLTEVESAKVCRSHLLLPLTMEGSRSLLCRDRVHDLNQHIFWL